MGLVIGVWLSASSHTVSPRQARCVRLAARNAPVTTPGRSQEVTTPSVLRCRMAWTDGPVLARTSDLVERVGDRLSVDRQGRYYSTTGRGQFHVWTPDGRLLMAVGRVGAGPGELATGRLGVFPSPSGTVYVIDNQHRLTVFDSTFRRLRTFSTKGSSSIFRATVLSDGSLLDAERPQDAAKYFGIASLERANAEGEPITLRAFGDISIAERRVARTSRGRLVAYAGGDRFWAGPPQSAGRGYELQQWRVDGTLLRTVRRQASWYPSGIDLAPAASTAGDAPRAEIEALSDLGDDLLFVVARVTSARGWGAYQRSPRDTVLRNRAFDIYWEVIDVRSGHVLAAEGPVAIGEAQHVLPTGWFHGTSRGYRPVDLPDGEEGLRGMELRLFAK
jgi:hypothetical protein